MGLGALRPCAGRDNSQWGLRAAGCGRSRCGLVAAGLQRATGWAGVWGGSGCVLTPLAQDHLWACWVPAEHSQTKRPLPSARMFPASQADIG